MAQADMTAEEPSPCIHGTNQDYAHYQDLDVSVSVVEVEMMDVDDDLEMATPESDVPKTPKTPTHLLQAWVTQESNGAPKSQGALEKPRPTNYASVTLAEPPQEIAPVPTSATTQNFFIKPTPGFGLSASIHAEGRVNVVGRPIKEPTGAQRKLNPFDREPKPKPKPKALSMEALEAALPGDYRVGSADTSIQDGPLATTEGRQSPRFSQFFRSRDTSPPSDRSVSRRASTNNRKRRNYYDDSRDGYDFKRHRNFNDRRRGGRYNFGIHRSIHAEGKYYDWDQPGGGGQGLQKIYYDDKSQDHEPEIKEAEHIPRKVSVQSFEGIVKATPAPRSGDGEIMEERSFRRGTIAVPSFNILDIPALREFERLQYGQQERKMLLEREQREQAMRLESERHEQEYRLGREEEIRRKVVLWRSKPDEWATTNRFTYTEEEIFAIDQAIAEEPARLAKELAAQLQSGDPFGLGLGTEFAPTTNNEGSFPVDSNQAPIDGNLNLLD